MTPRTFGGDPSYVSSLLGCRPLKPAWGATLLTLLSFASQAFRNLQSLPLEFHPRFNLLIGENGQGKTNLLEAIYYLFTLRPLRAVRPSEMIAWGQGEARLQGQIQTEVMRSLAIHLSARTRHILVNAAPPLDLDDYFADLRLVAFTPEDILLIRGSPQGRRRWLDRAVFNTHAPYMREVRDFLRILDHRNATLRQTPVDPLLLETLDGQFLALASRILRRRLRALQHLRPFLLEAWQEIFPDAAIPIAIEYEASPSPLAPPQDQSFEADDAYEAQLHERMAASLQRLRPREIERRSSLLGPHLDDLTFTFQRYPFKQVASQGQIRGLVLALKIAEIRCIEAQTLQTPLLLLDDVAGELDPRHLGFFFRFLQAGQGQIFLSSTTREAIPLPALSSYPCFHVSQGKIERAS